MRPNIVIVVLDDLGYAQLGCYGSDIRTPNIDRLAGRGLRYARFHVTGLCSPTRACLLTGRNAHAVGMGSLAELTLQRPGYTSRLPKSAGTLPRLLRDAGYATFGVGKWHQAPGDEQTAVGPFERWPLGLGFERYYGFLHGETDQWSPNLFRDNHFVDPPRSYEAGYHLTEDLADNAIRYVYDVLHAAPGKPFFLYFAAGAMHAPHQAPQGWTTEYAGAFEDGWDIWRERAIERQRALGVIPAHTTASARPPWVTPWRELPADMRRRYARAQEVYAGFLSHTDAQIGRVLDAIERAGAADDTLILLLSDNGASAEGGPHGAYNARGAVEVGPGAEGELERWGEPGSYPHYPWGWAWAGNAPFRLWKRYAWLGGTRAPLIVSWPRGLAARGEVRQQFCHAIDLAATVLECSGVAAPEEVDGVRQQPLDGASIAATFGDPAAPDPRRVQYFEVIGSRSIYADGWKATTDHVGRASHWELELLPGSRSFDEDRWSLFHLESDPAEATDVADGHPEVLQRLRELWQAEAVRNNVLPLSDVTHARKPEEFAPVPYPPRPRSVFRLGGGAINDTSVPNMARGVRITADVEADAASEGLLCALGGRSAGFALYVRDRRLTFAVSAQGRRFTVSGDLPEGGGRRRLSCIVRPLPVGGTSFDLEVDGVTVGSGRAELALTGFWATTMSIGEARGIPITDDYAPPFRWSGALHAVEIEVPGDGSHDVAARARDALRSE